jgi:hypothetical protein
MKKAFGEVLDDLSKGGFVAAVECDELVKARLLLVVAPHDLQQFLSLRGLAQKAGGWGEEGQVGHRGPERCCIDRLLSAGPGSGSWSSLALLFKEVDHPAHLPT